MKFFNIDLHVSVIKDIQIIFQSFGIQVDSLSLSSHDWVFGSKEKPEIITQNNWKNIDDNLIDAFYEHYKEKLKSYDGFIVTHTPFFYKLYEKFNKPIIVVASTRYEYPYTNDKQNWSLLNNDLSNNSNIILVSNNMFDKKYCELFINKKIEFIESLCSYTNAKYSPINNSSVLYSKIPLRIDNCVNKNELSKISWANLYSYKSIIHIPYNVSTMSIFEQYYANVPLFVPSIEMVKQMIINKVPIFSEISYRQVLNLKSDSLFKLNNDPNRYENLDTIMEWIKLSDFYRFKNIITFDSYEELNKKMCFNLSNISFKMQIENYEREQEIYNNWKILLSGIK